MLELVCKELGVEIGKKWLGDNGFFYCINSDGRVSILNGGNKIGCICWEDILIGKLKPIIPNFNIDNFVVISDVEKSYITYSELIKNEDYFDSYRYGCLPTTNTIYKVVDIKKHEDNNDIIYVIKAFEGEIYLIGEKGIREVGDLNVRANM